MQDFNVAEEAWDIKKIVLTTVGAVVVIGGVLYGANQLGLLKNTTQTHKRDQVSQKVEGVSVSEATADSPTPTPSSRSYSLPSKSDIEKKIGEMTKEVNSLNINEIASSSPQVQKVLQDIKNLQHYPENQAKEMCQKICSSL